jgi:hypothetical protein
MPTYTTSRDYDLLLSLMPHHRIVCFVDYRFHGDLSNLPPCRDVCATRYEPGKPESMCQPYLAAQSRGICYAGGLRLSPDEFKKHCERINLEFILPTSQTPPSTTVQPQ